MAVGGKTFCHPALYWYCQLSNSRTLCCWAWCRSNRPMRFEARSWRALKKLIGRQGTRHMQQARHQRPDEFQVEVPIRLHERFAPGTDARATECERQTQTLVVRTALLHHALGMLLGEGSGSAASGDGRARPQKQPWQRPFCSLLKIELENQFMSGKTCARCRGGRLRESLSSKRPSIRPGHWLANSNFSGQTSH
jgi:hypothetical protein